MFLSFRHAIRNLKSSGLYSLINILGLTLGIACTLILAKYIRYEWTTDGFHQKKESLVLATIRPTPMSMPELFAPRVFFNFDYSNYPEVEEACKLHLYKNDPLTVVESEFRADILVADSNFFELFDFKLLDASSDVLLSKPETMILSQKQARRLFGTENPIGKRVSFEGKDFDVAAILADFPGNSTLEFDAIVSSKAKRFWGRSGFEALLMKDISQLDNLNEKLADKGKEHEQFTESTLEYRRFEGVYFDSSFDLDDKLRHGNIQNIRILALIACLILGISIFNFVNLYSVILLKRTKDIGIQKVMGAGRKDLMLEFLNENLIAAFLAVSFSCILLELLSPFLQNYTGKSISLQFPQDLWLFGGMIIFLTILTSIYPFLKYPSINPIQAIQATTNSSNSLSLRKLMMTGQYMATIVLLIISMFFIKQLNFMMNKDLGFEQDHIIKVRFFSDIPRPERKFDENWKVIMTPELEAFQKAQEAQRTQVKYACNEIAKNPDIQFLSFGNSPLARWEAPWKITGEAGEYQTIYQMSLTPNFDSLYNLKVLEGRFFDEKRDQSRANKVIINESAKKFFEIENIDNIYLSNRYWGDDDDPFEVIGVIKDYHFQHLSQGIQPLVLMNWNDRVGTYFMMKLHEKKEAESIAFLADLFAEVNPDSDFEYSFIEDDVTAIYKEDRQVVQIYTAFTLYCTFYFFIGLIWNFPL